MSFIPETFRDVSLDTKKLVFRGMRRRGRCERERPMTRTTKPLFPSSFLCYNLQKSALKPPHQELPFLYEGLSVELTFS